MGGGESLGLVLLAGMLLALTGVFHLLVGVVSLSGDDYVVRPPQYAFELNHTAWGWGHIVVGILAITLGVGVLMGKSWAYVFALAVAFLSALGNFAYLPHAPIWSLVMIGFDVLVMRALVIALNEPE
jgi:hypothetical protein